MFSTRCLLALLMILPLGCGEGSHDIDQPISHPSGGAAGQGGTGGGGASGDAGVGGSPAKQGPSLVGVPSPLGGLTYIDATEVTRAQYARFLDEMVNVTPPTLPVETHRCDSLSDFAPGETCMDDASVCHGSDCGSHPQVCVSWCQAHAYCQWAGKRLCGAIGGGPLLFEVALLLDGTKNEWTNACASGRTLTPGQSVWPYGEARDPEACNADDHPGTGSSVVEVGTTVPVGTLPACTPAGPFAGVFDLDGNVSEWVDSCDDNNENTYLQAMCLTQGGAFLHHTFGFDNGESCGYLMGTQWYFGLQDVGFRCCSDTP